MSTIEAAGTLAGLRKEIEGLRAIIAEKPAAEAAERVGQVLTAVNAVAGSRPVSSELSKARRALRSRTPDKAEAQKAYEQAVAAFDAELAWREKAARDVLPRLVAYEKTIRDTIGLRKQARLPEHRVPDIAGCLAHHRDIALRF